MGGLHNLSKDRREAGAPVKCSLRGYRKLLLALVIVGSASFVDLSETQAGVITAVAGFMLGSNAAVHIGGSIAEAIRSRAAGSSGGSDGDSGAKG
jgi:hypothetical protein